MLKNSPSAMSSERSSTATVSPKSFVTRSSRTSTSATSPPSSRRGAARVRRRARRPRGPIMPHRTRRLSPGPGRPGVTALRDVIGPPRLVRGGQRLRDGRAPEDQDASRAGACGGSSATSAPASPFGRAGRGGDRDGRPAAADGAGGARRTRCRARAPRRSRGAIRSRISQGSTVATRTADDDDRGDEQPAVDERDGERAPGDRARVHRYMSRTACRCEWPMSIRRWWMCSLSACEIPIPRRIRRTIASTTSRSGTASTSSGRSDRDRDDGEVAARRAARGSARRPRSSRSPSSGRAAAPPSRP